MAKKFTKSENYDRHLTIIDAGCGMLYKNPYNQYHIEEKGDNIFMVQSQLPHKNKQMSKNLSQTKRTFVTSTKVQNHIDLSLSTQPNQESTEDNLHKLSQLNQSQIKREQNYSSRIPVNNKGYCITGRTFGIDDNKANSTMKERRTDNYFTDMNCHTSQSTMLKNSMINDDDKNNSSYQKNLPKFASTSRANVFTNLTKSNFKDKNGTDGRDLYSLTKSMKTNCFGCNTTNKHFTNYSDLPQTDMCNTRSIMKAETSRASNIKCGFMNSKMFWKDSLNLRKNGKRDKLLNGAMSQRNNQMKYSVSYNNLPRKTVQPNLQNVPRLLHSTRNEDENQTVEDELATTFDDFHHNAKLFLLGLRQKEARCFKINRNCQLDEIADQVLRANRLKKDLELFPHAKKQIWKDEISRANNCEDEAFEKRTKEFLAMNKDNFF